jgi:two-component system, LuxR family, response regulator FixJ
LSKLIYLIDDDDTVRESAAFLLKTNGYTVEQFPSGEAFLSIVDNAEPGCVMLDLQMPGLDGHQTQEALNSKGIRFPVLILTGNGDIDRAVRAMKNGALEFIEKPYVEEHLLATLDNAFAELERRVSEFGKYDDAKARIAKLSNRERQVMQGLLDGLPNKLIAYHLGLSIRTVESFRATLMEKLNVRTVSAAVRLAMVAGLPSFSEDYPEKLDG